MVGDERRGTLRKASGRCEQDWPGPRSLVTTSGVSVDFLSSGYLDISVHQVRFVALWIQTTMTLRTGTVWKVGP